MYVLFLRLTSAMHWPVWEFVRTRARVWKCSNRARSGGGRLGGGGLKLPHHAAPVDWRYSHIYFAGGQEMRTQDGRRGEERRPGWVGRKGVMAEW